MWSCCASGESLESGDLKRGGGSQRNVKLLLEDGTTYPVRARCNSAMSLWTRPPVRLYWRMVFANPKQVLLPGMFVRAVVEEGVNEQALLIPQQGVSRDPKGNPIALVVNSAPEKWSSVPLTLDRAIGDKWLVTKGLAPGDRLIVEGIQKVRAGDTVRAVAFEPPRGHQNPQANRRPRQSRRGIPWQDFSLIVLFLPGLSPSG